MTMITVSTKALAALDGIHSQRGIRTRAKALEVIAFEASPEHPLEQKIRDAKTVKLTRLEADRATAYFARKKVGTVETFSPTEALLEIEKLNPTSFLDVAEGLKLEGPSNWSVRVNDYL